MSEKAPRRQLFLRTRIVRIALLALAGIAVGAVADHLIPSRLRGIELAAELGSPVQPGPWGELYTVPFNIAAPEELLPVREVEAGGTHWLFKNFSAADLSRLLESAGVPPPQRTALFALARPVASGLELTPSPEMVVALPETARPALYRQLAQFPENRAAFYFIHKSTLEVRFSDSGVSRETLALFRQLCCEHGDYLVLGGLPALLAKLPDAAEKLRFMKALTRQKTMLIRLRVTKDSDVKELAAYWGKGCWAPNVRTILESVDRVPGSTFMSLLAILPPMPSGQAYLYPLAYSTSARGAGFIRDCHWTSLNFFHETPDPDSSNPAYFARELAANYEPVSGERRYGDVLVMAKPDGEIVHSAVFLADEIVFTKNGATAIYPWMFSTVPDLLNQYSFHAPDGQQLTLRYFRHKGA